MASIKKVARANGQAYEVRWRDQGKDRQITCKTLPQAKKEKVRIEDLLAAGRSTTQLTSRKTVAEVIEACIVASEPKLKARTIEGQRSMYKNHIKPAFGSRRITSLRAADIEKWIAQLAKKVAVGTAKNVFRVLSKACKYAIRHDWLVVNPCAGVELPQDNTEIVDERCFLNAEQVELLGQRFDGVAPVYGLIVRFAAWTGLRAGELAALRVGDLDLGAGIISVRRTVRRKAGGGWVYSSPKSKRSVRDVPLEPGLAAELRAYMAAHPWEHDPAAPLWPGSKNTGKGGVPDWNHTFDINNFCKRYFRPIVRSGVAGLPTALRWHDLRHTYASLLSAAGVELRLVSNWLGHGSISVTEKVYVHLFRTDHSALMARVGAFRQGSASAARYGGVGVS
ncbi:tyrosine-type recombinase/integrase [Streptomyces erythrochromogenes]|uniref:tyrosine-type recombinase/integrase n=1 Tax=Streptomyces erythrochromogenes TaxID=285574 RepID=UPI00381798A9